MSEYLNKSPDIAVLRYHLVIPARNRRAVFDKEVDAVLQEICIDQSSIAHYAAANPVAAVTETNEPKPGQAKAATP